MLKVAGSGPLMVSVPLMPALPSKQEPTLIDETVPVSVANADEALGPASDRATMLTTASQPALRKMLRRLGRRVYVSIVLLSPSVRLKCRDDSDAMGAVWRRGRAIGSCSHA
jgi:hypothetical protein